jgi:hypothetical protein
MQSGEGAPTHLERRHSHAALANAAGGCSMLSRRTLEHLASSCLSRFEVGTSHGCRGILRWTSMDLLYVPLGYERAKVASIYIPSHPACRFPQSVLYRSISYHSLGALYIFFISLVWRLLCYIATTSQSIGSIQTLFMPSFLMSQPVGDEGS